MKKKLSLFLFLSFFFFFSTPFFLWAATLNTQQECKNVPGAFCDDVAFPVSAECPSNAHRIGRCADEPSGKEFCCLPNLSANTQEACDAQGGSCVSSCSGDNAVPLGTCRIGTQSSTCCKTIPGVHIPDAGGKLSEDECSAKASGARCGVPGDRSCNILFGSDAKVIGDCLEIHTTALLDDETRKCCQPPVSATPRPAPTPSFTYTPLEEIPGQGKPGDMASYIKAMYMFTLGGVGIAGILMVVIGGFFYVTSAGNSSRVEKGKEIITDALIGIVVAFFAYLVLYVINPDLVNLDVSSLSTLHMTGGDFSATGVVSSGRQITGTCKDIDSNLAKDLNAASASSGVPATLLAAFMKRECAQAMTNPGSCSNSHNCHPVKGCVSGPMQFQDATWKDLGCTGNKNNRQDALACAAKKIAKDSGHTGSGGYSEAEIRKAALAYCGKCVDGACGGNNYCTGIVDNYAVYSSCSTTF